MYSGEYAYGGSLAADVFTKTYFSYLNACCPVHFPVFPGQVFSDFPDVVFCQFLEGTENKQRIQIIFTRD